MKTSKSFFLFLFSLCFGLGAHSQQPLADTGIYETTMRKIHLCIQSVAAGDSLQKRNYCYQQVLVENYEALNRYGVDTLADAGFKKYYPLYLKRFQKLKENNHALPAKDDSFLGGYVGQKKLPDGSYSITLFSNEERVSMVFLSDQPLNENEIKLLPKNKDNIAVAFNRQTKNEKVVRRVKSVVYLR